MKWDLFGFKGDPFSTEPIEQNTLSLYTGQEAAIKKAETVIDEKNTITVIEGTRGVGTTSFANYMRFLAQDRKDYFTPRHEIKVENGWQLETLLAAIISYVVREVEL
jgi:hypothetical protein